MSLRHDMAIARLARQAPTLVQPTVMVFHQDEMFVQRLMRELKQLRSMVKAKSQKVEEQKEAIRSISQQMVELGDSQKDKSDAE